MTLGSLVANLGTGIVDIAAAPEGLEVDVQGVAIHDPVDVAADEGDIVLGVGIDPTTADAATTLALLAKCGAVALVVKGEAGALVEAARRHGLALLVVPQEMAWSQLHTLLHRARAVEGADADEAPVGDLFALANAIASMVGGPTTIEDLHSTVLAYSSLDEAIDEPRRQTILGRRVPEEWIQRLQEDGVFRRIYSSTDPVRIDYRDEVAGYANRLAIAVRAGDQLLGSIWVAESSRPLGEEAEVALREAAALAALHVLRSRAADDLERRRRSDLLRAALAGRVAPEVVTEALGLSASSPLTDVAVELLLDDAEAAAAAAAAERAVSLVTLHCEAFRRPVAAVATGRVVHVVLGQTGDADRSSLLRFVQDLVARTRESLRVPMRAAIGRTVDGAGDLLVSEHESASILRALRGTDREVATLDDVRSRVFLLALDDAVARQPELRDGKVAQLVAHDRDKDTEYVRTLRAYLDHLGDVPAAAAALGVHPNTFRYRLRRLLGTVDLDLDDPVERLVAHIQLTLGDHG
jgi:DNA-binding PucR family transcriptional regulator